MKNLLLYLLLSSVIIIVFSCSKEYNEIEPTTPPVEPIPGLDIVTLPVVIHVIHSGEEIGVESNLSTERIQRQIEILNEDFRREKGTRGYNEHPDGADSKVEFVLAKRDPNGNTFNGINRINSSAIYIENLGYNQNHYAQYVYWNPNEYINIWTTPLPQEAACLVLGTSTGPYTELPGANLLMIPGDNDADGILINWAHFGESEIDCHARYGRTLTHEMGHFLGLLHPWGMRDCVLNDYCDDTPAVTDHIYGRITYQGCQGEDIMIGNYMNYSDDDVMNIFTKDQVYRMHYALKHHLGRNSLMTSPALGN